MLMEVSRALNEVGVKVTQQASADAHLDALLEVELDDTRARFAVEERGRAPYPNEIDGLEDVRAELARVATPMLVVPFVTEGVGVALTHARWSWADHQGNFDLRAPGLRLRQRRASKPRPSPRRTIPQGPGSLAVIRALIAFRSDEDEDQGAGSLAAQAHVSQPRASQVLARLRELNLVDKTKSGRWRPDRTGLLDRFLAEYKGPGGSVQYCYSLESPLAVAVRVAQEIGVLHTVRGPKLGLSADIGPDLVAPWRRPTDLVVYMSTPLEMSGLELVDAQSETDANVIVRVPSDWSVWPTPALIAEVDGLDLPLADPTQLIWDLLALGGDDREEAAGVLRTWLLRNP